MRGQRKTRYLVRRGMSLGGVGWATSVIGNLKTEGNLCIQLQRCVRSRSCRSTIVLVAALPTRGTTIGTPMNQQSTLDANGSKEARSIIDDEDERCCGRGITYSRVTHKQLWKVELVVKLALDIPENYNITLIT